jgi:DNA invertase Pin-like site-specific DNA recombinase
VAIARCVPSSESADFENRELNQWLADFLSANFRLTGSTLLVAKLDRLARNARFLLSIVECCGEGGVVFCDLPSIPAGPVGKFLVTQMAAVAELEAGFIGQRTRAALQAAKARGVALGGWRGGPKIGTLAGREAIQKRADAFAHSVAPMIGELLQAGGSLRQVAVKLAERGIRTSRGGVWSADAVRRVLLRTEATNHGVASELR